MAKFWHITPRNIAGLFVLVNLLAYGGHAGATGFDSAQDLFTAGDYEAAQTLANDLGTAEGYYLASKAITAQILLGYFDKPNEPAKEARILAVKALLLDPDDLDVRFQQGVAFGLETQSTGILKAWRKKLPRRMYDMIEALHRDAPEDPRSHALLGAWHLGIVNKVGKRNAYNWYKADPEAGKQHYETALELAKDNTTDDIVIMSNYAASTILLDNPDYGKKLLSTVLNMTPRNAAEAGVQKRMAVLATLYEEPEAFKRAAKDFLNNRPF